MLIKEIRNVYVNIAQYFHLLKYGRIKRNAFFRPRRAYECIMRSASCVKLSPQSVLLFLSNQRRNQYPSRGVLGPVTRRPIGRPTVTGVRGGSHHSAHDARSHKTFTVLHNDGQMVTCAISFVYQLRNFYRYIMGQLENKRVTYEKSYHTP